MNKVQACKEVYLYTDKRYSLKQVKDAVEMAMAQQGIDNTGNLPDLLVLDAARILHGHRSYYLSPDGKMRVTVEEHREYPNYKNVQIVALVRNILAGFGNGMFGWDDATTVGQMIQDAIENADYISDDVGRTWAMSFVPNYKESKT